MIVITFFITFLLNKDLCKDTNAITPLCDCKDTYYLNVDTCTPCANDKC